MMFQAYLDDEVSPAERAAVEQRCEESPENAEALREHKRASVCLYDALSEYRLKGSLRQRVMDNLPEMDRRSVELQAVNDRAKHPYRRSRRVMQAVPALAAGLIVIMAIVLQFNWPSATAGFDTIGVVAAVHGPAAHVKGASLERGAALEEQFVEKGHILETGPTGVCMIRVAADTDIKLAEDSRLEVVGPRDMRLVKGKAYFDVGRHARLFRVETTQGVVTVYGTKFEIALQRDRLALSVRQGEVQVENEAGWQTLRDSQETVILAQGKPSAPRGFRAERFAWADSIKPNPNAERIYLSEIASPADLVEINGVEVHMLDASQLAANQRISSIRVRWTPNTSVTNHCAVDVYVNNNQNTPIFKHRIEPEVFAQRRVSEYNVPVPPEVTRMPIVFNVRLVPDWASGMTNSLMPDMNVSAVAAGQ